jgi:hypothetical protein
MSSQEHNKGVTELSKTKRVVSALMFHNTNVNSKGISHVSTCKDGILCASTYDAPISDHYNVRESFYNLFNAVRSENYRWALFHFNHLS